MSKKIKELEERINTVGALAGLLLIGVIIVGLIAGNFAHDSVDSDEAHKIKRKTWRNELDIGTLERDIVRLDKEVTYLRSRDSIKEYAKLLESTILIDGYYINFITKTGAIKRVRIVDVYIELEELKKQQCDCEE